MRIIEKNVPCHMININLFSYMIEIFKGAFALKDISQNLKYKQI